MVNLTFVLTLTTVLFSLQLLSAAKTCQSPDVCGKGSCCRDEKHRAISLNAWKHAHFPLGPNFALVHSHEKGTCTVGKAQKGELCDSYCECDTGLSCWKLFHTFYPPTTCHDQAYIQQEIDKCKKNKFCKLPTNVTK